MQQYTFNPFILSSNQVVDSEDGADEKAITAMGLLSTIETLINCMEENPEIMAQIEPITLQVVGLILSKSVMGECCRVQVVGWWGLL